MSTKKTVKVRIEPGRVVMLTRRRSTSVKGGTYDISDLSDADQKRVLALDGVSEVQSGRSKSAASSSTKKE